MPLMEDKEFAVVATFRTWLIILPELIKNNYIPFTYDDGKGYKITYFYKQ